MRLSIIVGTGVCVVFATGCRSIQKTERPVRIVSSVVKTETPTPNTTLTPSQPSSVAAKPKSLPVVSVSQSTLTLALVGDVLPMDVRDPFRDTNVRGMLRSADIAFANLECPLSTRGTPTPLKFNHKKRLLHREWVFRASPEAATSLSNAGFDVVSLANNHMMDYGSTALSDTLNALRENGIAYAGAGKNSTAARRPAIVERNGIRVAFLSYVAANTLPGTKYFEASTTEAGLPFVREDKDGEPDVASRQMLREDIADAKKKADVVAVSFHWGQEFHSQPSAFQRHLAHHTVDAGADFIIGHHPHCLQGVESYKDKPIFYSLGNFVFYSRMPLCARSGIAWLTVSKDGVKQVRFHPVWVDEARPSWTHPRAIDAANSLHEVSRELRAPTSLAESAGRKVLCLDFKPANQTIPDPILASNSVGRNVSASHSPEDFVNVAQAVHDIIVELPYATTNNTFKTRFYKSNRALLRRGTARKLNKVQGILARSQLRLKIWDGYRPLSIQRRMWNKVRDARYVANPDKGGSRHNRGCAVDVTLVDRNGRELEMPTGFDDFSLRAHAEYSGATPAAKKNRALLGKAMTAAGFTQLSTEWWHFDDLDAARYPLADVTVATSADKVFTSKKTRGPDDVTSRSHTLLPGATVTRDKLRLKLRKKFTVATGPKSIRVSPRGGLIVVNNLYANCVTFINPRNAQPFRTIAVPGEPVECDFTHGGKLVWVSLYNKKRVVVIDTLRNKIIHTIAVGAIPKVVSVSPDEKWVYVANWSSASVSIIDAKRFQRVRDVRVGNVPRGICFTPDGRFAYVANMGSDTLTKIEVTAEHKPVKTIHVGANPRHLVMSRDGRRIYISHNAGNCVRKFDTVTDKVLSTVQVGQQPRTIALAPDGKHLFVCNYEDNNAGVVNVETMKQISTVATSVHPIGMTVTPNGKSLWISNYRTSLIMVFDIIKTKM
jgi:poly-gamma-glutamate synthesis protein (capsule biosynthesis protein)